MKKIKTMNIDEEIYKQFRLYAISINSSVSREIEKIMKETLKTLEKERRDK